MFKPCAHTCAQENCPRFVWRVNDPYASGEPISKKFSNRSSQRVNHEETTMSFYVVKRELPGITPDTLQSAAIRAKTCCAEMSQEGQPVRWVRSFFLPFTSQTHCYFEAASREAVEEANQRARIPFTEIAEVVEMTPDSI